MTAAPLRSDARTLPRADGTVDLDITSSPYFRLRFYTDVTDRDTGRSVPEKSLIGILWRYALRCIDDLGLILRAETIRSKLGDGAA